MLSHLDVRPFLFYSTLVLLALTGAVNGYVVVRVLKLFSATKAWKIMAMISAVLFPLFAVASIFLIDFFELSQGADEEFPIFETIGCSLLWLIVCCPATFYGAYIGMKSTGNAELGVSKRNSIPRDVNLKSNWWMSTPVMSLASGVVIFASFYVIFFYMWQSIWRSEAYAMISYLMRFLLLLMVVVAELSVLCTFLTLREGDYKWQWRSFWVGAGSVVWVGGFALYYMVFHMDLMLLTNDFVYLLWTALFCVSYMLVTGTTSVLASTVFVNLIFFRMSEKP